MKYCHILEYWSHCSKVDHIQYVVLHLMVKSRRLDFFLVFHTDPPFFFSFLLGIIEVSKKGKIDRASVFDSLFSTLEDEHLDFRMVVYVFRAICNLYFSHPDDSVDVNYLDWASNPLVSCVRIRPNDWMPLLEEVFGMLINRSANARFALPFLDFLMVGDFPAGYFIFYFKTLLTNSLIFLL